MKKSLFLVAAAALALTACSNDDATQQAQATAAPQAVAFDTYTSGTTRAYSAGVMTTDLLGNPGFGVFAYHNEGTTAANGTYSYSTGPNFMYNQPVTYTSSAWTYTPVKYWPNETTKDMLGVGNYAYSGAVGAATKNDVLSFFAYAPYKASGSGTAGTDPGINAIMANTITNADPWIQYTVSTEPKTCVDLVWGVAPAGGLTYTAVNGVDVTVNQGLPLKDLVKPSKDQKIKFLFQHALARIGMTVVAAVDQIAPGGTLNASETKIFVNSVTIADHGTTIPRYGKLNLNNGSAGVANWTDINTDTKYSAVINSTNLNSDLQTGGTGVTTTEKTVIAKDDSKDQYLMLIPTPAAAAVFDVTIDYNVVTTDSKLSAGTSTVNNVITKTVTLSATNTFDDTVVGFVNNKAYNLKLILGLTSVKLDAEVADWEVLGSTPVDLPRNQE